MLLEEAVALARLGLGALLVLAAPDGVAEGAHGEGLEGWAAVASSDRQD